MNWTSILILQVVSGAVGAHLAAMALHQYRFGSVVNTLWSDCLLAGALSGYFLQAMALTVVTASGSLNEPTLSEVFFVEALTGAVVGGIAMAIVGFVIYGEVCQNVTAHRGALMFHPQEHVCLFLSACCSERSSRSSHRLEFMRLIAAVVIAHLFRLVSVR